MHLGTHLRYALPPPPPDHRTDREAPHLMSIRNLEHLLDAALGGGDRRLRPRRRSVGATVWRNLLRRRLQRPDLAGQPEARAGRRASPSLPDVRALPQAPDLAVICTPPATVPGLIAELGERGTRAAVVITAGIAAATDRRGRQATDARRGAAAPAAHPRAELPRPAGAGPRPERQLRAHRRAAGPLAFVSQSGALVTAMLDWADVARHRLLALRLARRHAPTSTSATCSTTWPATRATRAILLYIESIKTPRKFMSAARAAARNKPVIVVKAGRAPAGRAGRGLAHRRAGRRRRGLRRRDPPRRHAARGHAAASCSSPPRRWRAGPRCRAATRLADPHQRRRRRRAGRRRRGARRRAAGRAVASDAGRSSTRCCRRPGRAATRSTSSATRRSSATSQALQTLLDDADEADAVLFMHAPTAIVPQRRDRRGAACRSCRRRAAPVLACWLGADAVAGRGAGSRRPASPATTRPRRRCAPSRMLVDLPAQPGAADGGAAGAADGRRAGAPTRPRARAICCARRWPPAASG